MDNDTYKPDVDRLDEMLEFLDEIREGGTINMFGAVPYIQNGFFIDKPVAIEVLMYWMDTFEERHDE